MTGNQSFLHSLFEIAPQPVTLPKGDVVYATHSGQINLTSYLTLYDVLLVPRLGCNFISVAKFTKDSPCVILFSGDGCMIQDLASRTEI